MPRGKPLQRWEIPSGVTTRSPLPSKPFVASAYRDAHQWLGLGLKLQQRDVTNRVLASTCIPMAGDETRVAIVLD